MDACHRAMTLNDHHDWITAAADALTIGGYTLWQALCASWATTCLSRAGASEIADAIESTLANGGSARR